MTDKELDILTNIIGGVESGGQVYGERKYDAYAAPYQNSPNEVTVTLGWCQFYGNTARKLCQTIFNKDSAMFRKYDNAKIENRLKQDWVEIKWKPTLSEKNSLINIITTSVGKETQDELFKEDMKTFIKDAEVFGISDVGAQMMYCEIRHLGGKLPAERIFKRASKPYTADTVYSSLLLDQNDTSNNNQVGDKIYQSRHQKCVEWIHAYIYNDKGSDKVSISNTIIQNVINDAVNFSVSIANDNIHGYSQAVRSLYNTISPTSFDCSSLVCTAYYYAFIKNGLVSQANYLKANCSYTGNMGKMINCGFEVVATNQTGHSQMKKGDIELNIKYHTAMAIDGDNIVHARSSEGTNNTIDDSGNEIRVQPWYLYSKGWDQRLRFTGKGISSVSSSNSSSSSSATTTITYLRLGSTGDTVKDLQEKLNQLGYGLVEDGEFGENTQSAVLDFQIKNNIEVDGVVGPTTLSFLNTAIGKLSTTNSSSSVKIPYIVKITASELNIRSNAGMQYQIVGVIKDQGVYTITDEKDGWGKLKSGAGWICLEYTKKL